MKTLTLLISIGVFALNSVFSQTSINEVRTLFQKASTDQSSAENFYNTMVETRYSEGDIFQTYRGASQAIVAKYQKGKLEKMNFFKEGAENIENSIAESPENIEMRLVRLSIQENAPSILGYDDDIEEDKSFILENYSTASDKIQGLIKHYVSDSKLFSESEKKKING